MFLPPTNKVCEGYIFTNVCLSTGEGVSVQGDLLSGGSLSRGSLSRGVSVKGGGLCPQGVPVTESPSIILMCLQYVPYWNAFLLYFPSNLLGGYDVSPCLASCSFQRYDVTSCLVPCSLQLGMVQWVWSRGGVMVPKRVWSIGVMVYLSLVLISSDAH